MMMMMMMMMIADLKSGSVRACTRIRDYPRNCDGIAIGAFKKNEHSSFLDRQKHLSAAISTVT
jgi:hypothetical protein